MKRKRFLFALLLTAAAVFATVSHAHAQKAKPETKPEKLASGKGSFLYTDTALNVGKPLTVWYFQPPDPVHARVLFVMHGTLRNGEEYRDQWAALAQKYGLLLIVPEFNAKDYPSGRYNRGNIMGLDDAVLQPKTAWTFPLIERLFDDVKKRTGNQSAKYDIFGHSAGGQFVHRFVLFMPHARYRRAIAANSGYYTLPTVQGDDPAYPFSFKGTGTTETDIALVLQRDMVILLGESDTDPNDPDLYHSPEADRQGMYRLARGKNFDKAAHDEAAHLHIKTGWRVVTVPGVGHSNTNIAAAAAAALYEKP